jgi:hypothetical protein
MSDQNPQTNPTANNKVKPTGSGKGIEKARQALADKRAKIQSVQVMKAHREHVMELTNTLSQIKIQNPLNDKNFAIWLKQIIVILKSLFLEHFVITDPLYIEGKTNYID